MPRWRGLARTSSRPWYARGDRSAFAAERQIVGRTKRRELWRGQIVCTCNVRLIVLLHLAVGLSCSGRRAPALTGEVGGGARVNEKPTVQSSRERVVQLPHAGTDTSCLDRAGGTVVAGELSDDDVAKIVRLIRRADALPISAISYPAMLGDRRNPAGPDFEARTGAGCGPLSGHGGLYRIGLVNGEWAITERGSWAS
jgi:hypothetical protein